MPKPTPDFSALPFPEDAPFTAEQQAWISGYLAGMKAQLKAQDASQDTNNAAGPGPLLNVLYGSQTGNAESVAEDAAAMAMNQGMEVTLKELDAVSVDELQAMTACLVVVSTYGEGEMPDNAKLFWESVSSTQAPRLEQLTYAVLGLGDTSYDQFCQSAKLIDTRLEQLGARRAAQRIDCDVDFEDPATAWLEASLPEFSDQPAAAKEALNKSTPVLTEQRSAWTRKRPFSAQMIANDRLSGAGSAKDIRHIAISLGDSDVEYTAGDALGIVPKNHADLVAVVIQRLGGRMDSAVMGYDAPLGELLTQRFEIMTPSRDLLEYLHTHAGDDELSHVVGNGDKEALDAYLWGKDVLDLLNLKPSLRVAIDEFVALLRPLQHRAYSIASSELAFPGEVHLTVAAVRWHAHERAHRGVASTWLADALSIGREAEVFPLPNKNFRLPKAADVPVIMVGPGTGIAPFRAFLQARQQLRGGGKNWLFFGDQHRSSDFIYSDELAALATDGTLTRLDLAFSRDQRDKLYVQHRMRENSRELYAWLEDGASVYVCGDATRMARDVDQALHDVVQLEGALTESAASDYINRLKREKRYLRDVY
ncbi:MAG: sulfite reductase flavoprotein subunit alpha [Pseudomonadota bacterium]